MRILKSILILAILVAAGWWAWHQFFPPPERIIRRKLLRLAAVVSERPGGNIARVAQASRIGSFFHPNVSIEIAGFGRDVTVQGRGELEQAALTARQAVGQITVELYNVRAEQGADPLAATAAATALVKLSGQNDPAVQELLFSWEKLDGQWLIRSVAPAKILKVE